MNNTAFIPIPSTPTFEDLLLRHDRRGISALRPYLPADNTRQTAAFALQHCARVIIVTGFYVNGTAETDGPPGALALANGFLQLDSQVTLVTDRYCMPFLQSALPACKLFEFPITGAEESRRIAQDILAETRPTLLISVERCGLTREGFYRNMHSVDISPYTARLDELFIGQVNTIGIGDGGNEIGMGLLYSRLIALPQLVANPTTTATTHLLISTVSNWAAYGLLGAMSVVSGKNLLPSVAQQSRILQDIVARGASNGVNGRQENKVDGFDEAVNDAILEDIHRLVDPVLKTEKRQ